MTPIDRLRVAAARGAQDLAAAERDARAAIFDAILDDVPSPWRDALTQLEGDIAARVGAVHTHLLDHPLAPSPDGGPVVIHNPLRCKAMGAVYTPAAVVDALVDEALGPLAPTPEAALALRVLDPACGTGSFLLGAFRWIVARAAPLPNAATRALQCLHGVDLDADAAALCARVLARACTDAGGDAIPPRVIPGDALAMNWSAAFAEVFEAGGFDAVIGNPPYVSYAGRQAQPLAPHRRAALRQRFPAASRWPSAHGYFIELAARELSPRVIALVVPDQVAHLPRYESLRAALAATHPIALAHFHGEDLFDGVLTPALSFVAARGSSSPTRLHDARAASTVTRALSPGEAWIPRGPDALLDKLREGAVSIAPHVVDRGLRTTDARAQVVSLVDAAEGDLPALEGACVHRYRCDPPSIALRRSAIGAVRVAPDAAWDEVRFVLRQTASFPVVGPRRHARHFRNSLLGLRATPGGLDLRYVVGILNSALLRWAYQRVVQESSQRAFPQVKKVWLGALPVRAPRDGRERALHDAIVAKVDALLDDPSRGDLDAALDADVFALYALTDAEVAAVTTCGSAPR